MTDGPRIKYLFLDMKPSRYKTMQAVLISAWALGGIASFVFLRLSERWYFRYLWLVCLIAVVGEIVETAVALKKCISTPSEACDSRVDPNQPDPGAGR